MVVLVLLKSRKSKSTLARHIAGPEPPRDLFMTVELVIEANLAGHARFNSASAL
jgi:hypothetical protein